MASLCGRRVRPHSQIIKIMKVIFVYLFSMAALLLTACKQNTAAPSQTAPSEQPSATTGGESLPWATDRDLVCDMKVAQNTEDTVHYAGKIYGFCSSSCKASFLESPSKYVSQ